MKSSALIGTPSDQTALGLIWYTTVCGLALVCLALVTKSVLSCRLSVFVGTKVVGQTWFMTSWSTNSASLRLLMLNPARSSSSAYVIVPPLLTAPALVDELGALLLPPLLQAASASRPAAVRVSPPMIRFLLIVSPPSSRCERRGREIGTLCGPSVIAGMTPTGCPDGDPVHGTGSRLQP